MSYFFLSLFKLKTPMNTFKLKYVYLYVETEQPWNAFEDSVTPVPVDAQNEKLQSHNLQSTDDKFLDLSASEVGVYMVYYCDNLYSLESQRNSQKAFHLPGT